MKKLLFVILLVAFTFSCDPPANTSDFVAVYTFTTARKTIDVHNSMTAQYYGVPATVNVGVSHIMPMQVNHAYIDTVILNNINMDQLNMLHVQVQQGYVVQDTAFNLFKIRLYRDGNFIWEGHNLPTGDNTYNHILYF
jgi:hypothetical protein